METETISALVRGTVVGVGVAGGTGVEVGTGVDVGTGVAVGGTVGRSANDCTATLENLGCFFRLAAKSVTLFWVSLMPLTISWSPFCAISVTSTPSGVAARTLSSTSAQKTWPITSIW